MRIFVQDYAGHPFQVQLSRSLAARGWEVRHSYNASDITPRGELLKRDSDPEGFSVVPIEIPGGFDKYSFVKRFQQEGYYGKEIAKNIREFAPDVVINANTPLAAYIQIQKAMPKGKMKHVFWMQDFYSVAANKILRKKIPVLGGVIGAYFTFIEKRILKKADEIVLITEDFNEVLKQWGIDQKKISVIPNWSPIENLPQMTKTESKWSKIESYQNTFNIVYTGTLAFKHNPGHILRIADHFKDYKDVKVLVVSEGKVIDELKDEVKEKGIANIDFLPFQPFNELPDVMAAADVLLALLEDDAGKFSVPSKVLTYHCAGRPILMIGPEQNLAARIINDNGSGISVSSAKVEDALKFLSKMYDDKASYNKLASSARAYAEANFRIEEITDRFESVFKSTD